jgi:hypothetical protein
VIAARWLEVELKIAILLVRIPIMGVSDLRTDLIKILGSIDNEELLRTIYDFVKQRDHADEGKFWASLTDEQKKEIYLSYQESEEDATLKKWEDIKNKY